MAPSLTVLEQDGLHFLRFDQKHLRKARFFCYNTALQSAAALIWSCLLSELILRFFLWLYGTY